MVVSAASLIGSRGVHATSLSDILDASQAPRGSIYHHFPDGKEELVGEAMRWTTEQVLAFQRGCTAANSSGVLDHFVRLFRRSMVSSRCRAGCAVAGAIIDTYEGQDRLIETGRSSFRSWTGLLTGQLVGVGIPRRDARSLAITTIAAVEGALILCRAEGSVAPLDTVAASLRLLTSHPKRRRSGRAKRV